MEEWIGKKFMIVLVIRKDFMIVNMGFYYLLMYGVFWFIFIFDGEDVIDCELILGYLYRGMEKIVENWIII